MVVGGCAAGALFRGAAGRAAGAGGVAELGVRPLSGAVLASRTPLRAALSELTAGGAVRPTLTINRVGQVVYRGQHLATISSSGEIHSAMSLGGTRVIGRVANGQLWEITGSREISIGFLKGRLLGANVSLRAAPNVGAQAVATTSRNTAVEVLQISSGWYEVRLVSGEQGWVWMPLLALVGAMSDEQKEGTKFAVDSDMRRESRATSGETPILVLEMKRKLRSVKLSPDIVAWRAGRGRTCLL